jgi:hypothetical protein
MRRAVVGASVIATLVLASFVASLVPNVSYGERVASVSGAGSGGLIALATPAGEHAQQVTVIDPEKHVLSVYHIDLVSGEIVLKSVRNIHWDLQMTEFNATAPAPGAIRAMLDQKK